MQLIKVLNIINIVVFRYFTTFITEYSEIEWIHIKFEFENILKIDFKEKVIVEGREYIDINIDIVSLIAFISLGCTKALNFLFDQSPYVGCFNFLVNLDDISWFCTFPHSSSVKYTVIRVLFRQNLLFTSLNCKAATKMDILLRFARYHPKYLYVPLKLLRTD